nr:uncharacterized protein LOC111416229 [Onthophagus taurus]
MSKKNRNNYTQYSQEESSSSSLNYDKSKICRILRGEELYNEKKVIYSGINRPLRAFKHVNGCYLNESSIKPFLRITPDQKRVNVSIHGVKKLQKTPSECSRNVQTQTSCYEDLNNNLNCSFTQRRDEYERNKSSSKFASTSTMKEFSDYSSSDRLKDLESFRKENYFETHDVNGLINHKCVHQFKINDRFLPEPINPDVYGISRCIICNKALEMINKHEKDNELKRRSNKKDVVNIKKRYEMKLKPVTVNIGTGKEVMKISVPYGLEEERFGRRKNLVFDSFALRLQKGVF